MSREGMFNWRPSAETVANCAGLYERWVERQQKAKREAAAKAGPVRQFIGTQSKAAPATKKKRFGRGNPVPMELKLQIVRRLNNNESGERIAQDVGLSRNAVSAIGRKAGIHRGSGNHRYLIKKGDRAA